MLRGFSLGEVLLAAFVLTSGLLSVIALMASSLRHSMESRDTIIAVELAQEGIESVRNVRDNDLTAGNDGFTAFNPGRKHCRADYNDPINALDCNPAQGGVARYNLQSNTFYQHNDTGAERFSRYIFVDYNPGQDQALVRSFVFWGGATLPPASGNPSSCTVSNRCVFTEVTLTSWK